MSTTLPIYTESHARLIGSVQGDGPVEVHAEACSDEAGEPIRSVYVSVGDSTMCLPVEVARSFAALVLDAVRVAEDDLQFA